MKVLFLPDVEDYLVDLIEILYEKEYFGFRESAVQYVKELVSSIIVSLPNKQKKIAPLHFSKYGRDLYYTTFRQSKHTRWYVFFTIHEDQDVLLIRYLATNHTVSQHL